MAKEDKRRETREGERGRRETRKAVLEMGEWLNIRSRTSASSVAATTKSRRSGGLETRNRGIALIQNYLDTARMDMRGAFAAFQSYAVRKIIFISISPSLVDDISLHDY